MSKLKQFLLISFISPIINISIFNSMKELIISLMIWVGANTDYKIDFPVPQVERMGIIMEEIILPSHKLFFVSWYSYL